MNSIFMIDLAYAYPHFHEITMRNMFRIRANPNTQRNIRVSHRQRNGVGMVVDCPGLRRAFFQRIHLP